MGIDRLAWLGHQRGGAARTTVYLSLTQELITAELPNLEEPPPWARVVKALLSYKCNHQHLGQVSTKENKHKFSWRFKRY